MSNNKKNYEKDDIIILSGSVGSVEEENVDIAGKLRNTFYLQSKSNPEKKLMCIYWQRISKSLKAGDEVLMRGRFNEKGTFLAWSLLITGSRDGRDISDKEGVSK